MLTKFTHTLRRPDYAFCHCVSFDDGHPRIGEFRQNQICIWFRKDQAFKDCFAILQSIPMRSVEFIVTEVPKTLAAILRPLNYRVIHGSDHLLVSVEATHASLQAARDYGADDV